MQRLPLIAVLAAAFVVFSANIGGYDLWPPDEPRFGQIAREMMQSRDPIALTINGGPYKEKPPFLFWLIALASLPFGDVTETTARVPSVAAAMVAVYFTFRLASRLYGHRVGLCASFVLIASGLFWWEARSVRTDMLLTGCLTAALYAFWMRHETKSTRWLLALYAAIAAAVFAKGPPGIVFPYLLAIAFYWGRRAERRALHLGWGLLAVAAVISIWLVPAYFLVPATQQTGASDIDLGANLFRQTIGRFFLGVSKANPPWYFLQNLPLLLFPWTFVLPWTLWFAWKRRRENDAMRLLLCWILPALIFFSIGSGKRSVYILPLVPAFATLIGYSLVTLSDDPRYAWVRRAVGSVWTLFLLALGACFPFVAYWGWGADDPSAVLERFAFAKELDIPIVADMLRALSVVTGVALVFAFHAAWTTMRKQARTIHFAMAGHFAGIALVCVLIVMPHANAFKGAGGFCAPLRHLTETGVDYQLYSVAFSREEYIFYTKHAHEEYLVNDWPLTIPEGGDTFEFVSQQRALGSALRKATGAVAIADWANVADAEVDALRAKSESVFSFAKSKSPLVDEFKTAVAASVHQFAQRVAQAGPAFMIVQEGDWRWLLPFAPELRQFTLIARASVGSDKVMLFANAEGASLLK